jgi:16S rRNA (uracil1498-N3)-methyltransferase
MHTNAGFLPMTTAHRLRIGQEFDVGPELHAALVLREIRVKEAFTIRDAAGAFFRASLLASGLRDGRAVVYETFTGSPESPLELTLFVAILARQRMITVAQKAAELGCARLVPVITDHSVQRGAALEKEKPWAWQGQGIKGSRQCRRSSLLEVQAPMPLSDALASAAWASAALRMVLDDRAADSDALAAIIAPIKVCALLVGPEGGWSERERIALDAASARATRVRFGARVLRAETAVLVGVALLQHRLGDLG